VILEKSAFCELGIKAVRIEFCHWLTFMSFEKHIVDYQCKRTPKETQYKANPSGVSGCKQPFALQG